MGFLPLRMCNGIIVHHHEIVTGPNQFNWLSRNIDPFEWNCWARFILCLLHKIAINSMFNLFTYKIKCACIWGNKTWSQYCQQVLMNEKSISFFQVISFSVAFLSMLTKVNDLRKGCWHSKWNWLYFLTRHFLSVRETIWIAFSLFFYLKSFGRTGSASEQQFETPNHKSTYKTITLEHAFLTVIEKKVGQFLSHSDICHPTSYSFLSHQGDI